MLLDNEEGKKQDILEEDSLWVRGKTMEVLYAFVENFELERHGKEELVPIQREQDAITQVIFQEA